jgi:hypothetical protein
VATASFVSSLISDNDPKVVWARKGDMGTNMHQSCVSPYCLLMQKLKGWGKLYSTMQTEWVCKDFYKLHDLLTTLAVVGDSGCF